MNLKRTQLHILHEKTDLSRKAKAGVSLHCHTEHSKEMMDFVPNYADRIPLISTLWQREKAQIHGTRRQRTRFFYRFLVSAVAVNRSLYNREEHKLTMPVSMRSFL